MQGELFRGTPWRDDLVRGNVLRWTEGSRGRPWPSITGWHVVEAVMEDFVIDAGSVREDASASWSGIRRGPPRSKAESASAALPVSLTALAMRRGIVLRCGGKIAFWKWNSKSVSAG